MRRFEWDKSLEELCSSPEEVQELKKVASLLRDMPDTQPSPAFQAMLRAQLLEKAQLEGKSVSPGGKMLFLFHKGYKYGWKLLRARSLPAAAAAILLVLSLSLFYGRGPVEPFPAGITSPENLPEIIVADNHDPDDIGIEKHSPPAEQEPAVKPPGESGDTPGAEGSAPEKTAVPADNPPAVEGSDEPVPPEEEPVKEDPDFEAWKGLRSYRLAGAVNLPSVYYGVEQGDATAPAENVRCAWKPRKTVYSANPGGAGVFGTKAWAVEDLSNNGFIVGAGDYIQSNLYENPKGLFAEVFYRSQKGAGNALTLVLHYQEGTGILAYYCKEDGGAGQPGFYPLLSPAEAFKQADGLKWFAPLPRLDFSFQEVALTYHDFLLEENGQEKTVKLPAYRFLGRETINNGGELVIYLPAIK